jgi:hypothetical protein
LRTSNETDAVVRPTKTFEKAHHIPFGRRLKERNFVPRFQIHRGANAYSLRPDDGRGST